jgi:predicted acylesterase/phospholipase RssA
MKYLAIGPGAMGFFMYLGVLSRLKLQDLEELSGSSAGGLLAFLYVAARGDIPAMLDFSIKIPIKQVMKPNLKNLLTNYGLVPTNKLEEKIKTICKKFLKKSDVTFQELYEYNPIKLHISAFCVDLKKTVYFSVDTHPTMSVCRAVSASVAIPLIMSSVRIGDWNYIDGGTQEQIPGDPFIGKNFEEVFCIKIAASDRTYIKDLKSYALTIVSSLASLRHDYNFKTMYIPNETFDMFNFSYGSEEKLRMFMAGHHLPEVKSSVNE